MGLLKAFVCAILIIAGIFGVFWFADTYPDLAAILLGSALLIFVIIVLTFVLWFNFF